MGRGFVIMIMAVEMETTTSPENAQDDWLSTRSSRNTRNLPSLSIMVNYGELAGSM